jgi:4-amino-4-deoxy-L-arabinose transferase-like glycosyltransferase
MEPPETGRTREDLATLPSTVPFEIGRFVMAHWPRTAAGKAFSVALIAVVVPLTIWFLVTVPSYVLWALGLIAIISVALFLWRRRLDAAREKAWVGEFSFGDVVGRMKARDALDRAREPGTLTAASASSGG